MAWINKHISMCFFLVYFCYSITTLPIIFIHGETPSPPPHFKVVNFSSLVPKTYCQRSSSGSAIGSQKLRMVSRFGPCYSNANRTKTTSSDQSLDWDQGRVGSIDKRLNHEELGNDHGEYTVKIGLGTPQQDYEVIVDTGSNLSWVRCQSKPEDPLYDPLKSSTYNTNNTLCSGTFDLTYGDDSYTQGNWGCDTLTLDDVGVVMNFRFGCAKKYDDKTGDNFAGAAGMLGLGKGDKSLPSQLFSTASYSSVRMFSYCIPLTSSHEGNLYFGNEAKRKSYIPSIQFTPLVKGSEQMFYYLDLVGISVAGEKLNVLATTFTSRGTIIDSGTTITRLPQVVYSALRAAFRKSMSRYYTIKENFDKLMDTCYNKKSENILLPEVIFHFGGGTDVTLSSNGILWVPRGKNVMCLAFAATENSEGPSIIGNVQQRGLNVLYDLEGGRIGFGAAQLLC